MLRAITVIIFLLISCMAFAEEKDGKKFEVESTQKTRFGVLEIGVGEDRDILFNSQSIFKKKTPQQESEGWSFYEYCSSFCVINNLYQIGNKDIAFVTSSDGSMYGINENFFITIEANKKPIISNYFPASRSTDGSIAKLIGNQIIVDNIDEVADYKKSKTILIKKVIYENGTVNIIKGKVSAEEKMSSCKYLHDLYKLYVKNDCGVNAPYDDVCHTGGEATAYGCGRYLGDSVYEKLTKVAKVACKTRRTIDLARFKQQVCGLK